MGPVTEEPMSPVFEKKTRTIPTDLVEDLYDSYEDGYEEEGWTRIADQEHGHRRWQADHTLVLKDPDGAFWGVDYRKGLTEMQDHDFPWRPDYGGRPGTLELRRMYPVPVSKVDYWYAK